MEYKLTKGAQSNYEIALTVSPDEMAANKEKSLKQFQKDMDIKGFRKGEVPLDMVEQNVQPAYLQLALYEEAVHQGTMQVVKENEEIKFIGNIYDLGQEEKDGNITFSYKLDIYPEVTENNDAWKKASVEKIDDQPTDQEVDDTLANLQKQYADYQPADTTTIETICKASFVILDESGSEIDKGSLYIGKEEFDEFDIMKTHFVGKTEGEEFQIDYSEELPPMLHIRNKDASGTPTHIKITVSDIRSVNLPERTEENIKKFFGNEELKTLDELKTKVTDAIKAQKKEALLMQAVEKYLWDVHSSYDVIIPKTLIEEEMKSRMESLKERFGGEEGLKKYLEQIGEEEQSKMTDEIKTAAKSSLEKFFLLRNIIEQLGLEVQDTDRQTPMAIEDKLYGHFNS